MTRRTQIRRFGMEPGSNIRADYAAVMLSHYLHLTVLMESGLTVHVGYGTTHIPAYKEER